MTAPKSVVIIGAGPYGLSIAAELAELGIEFSIFGRAMQSWREAMPPGMLLKSDGFASNLHDPRDELTLEAFCQSQGKPYAASGLPVPIETFNAYGQAFQRRFAPNLDERMVRLIESVEGGLALTLDDGARVLARQVVVAAGIGRFGFTPGELAALPEHLASHASCYGDLSGFDGKSVIVVGAGASAVDIAALLLDRAASVTLVARAPSVRFHGPPRERRWSDRLLRPGSGLGPGWRSYLAVHAPLVFHAMPEPFRLAVVRRHLGPAPGWFMRDRVEGRVPCLTGQRIVEASDIGGRVQLVLADGEGARRSLEADHVIAATGYRVDLERLGFLSEDLRRRLRMAGGSPALSSHFESSVPGLYFVGAAAAASFGPLLRFAYGAAFTARRVARRLARNVAAQRSRSG